MMMLPTAAMLLSLALSGVTSASAVFNLAERAGSTCKAPPVTQHLPSPPYQNYFYSDCHAASQVVVTSPLPGSNLSLIGPRLLVAWPAGNSGAVAFFAPTTGPNGTLAIALVKSAGGNLNPVYVPANSSSLSGYPRVGVTGLLHFNTSATMVLPLLGSVRTIRDFTEGPSILVPEIQNAIKYAPMAKGGASLSRIWLDNITSTYLTFTPHNGASAIKISKKKLLFGAGTYLFNASFDYPQLTQYTKPKLLSKGSQGLITQDAGRVTSLEFLSYTDKLLAGAWRFLTYFGRDSQIALLLMQPILSQGKGGAIETVIAAVLDRILRRDGQVCHEETIGDYATYLNMQNGKTSTKPMCSYIMIDSDYYLPVVMREYFVNTATGKSRAAAFFAQTATGNFSAKGHTYSSLALVNAERIMNKAADFAAPGGQTEKNLRHLEPNQIVGEWRDSTYGIGGGRIPFDVNTGLVPAALRAIADLAAAGYFPTHPNWATLADQYAQVWEDETLKFFQVTVPAAKARSLLKSYVQESKFPGPSQAGSITGPVTFHAISLMGYNNTAQVRVMNTDVAFRLFMLNTTNNAQLTSLLNQTAQSILLRFPAGLSTDVGMIVANPAYGGRPVYAANWTTSAYHGTVVWSWPMAMMAKGLERQLGRCSGSAAKPAFCSDASVYNNVRNAYNHLWDLIDANRAYLSGEVWTWKYANGMFQYLPFGAVSPTESDIRQLWSLTFLSVTRNKSL